MCIDIMANLFVAIGDIPAAGSCRSALLLKTVVWEADLKEA